MCWNQWYIYRNCGNRKVFGGRFCVKPGCSKNEDRTQILGQDCHDCDICKTRKGHGPTKLDSAEKGNSRKAERGSDQWFSTLVLEIMCTDRNTWYQLYYGIAGSWPPDTSVLSPVVTEDAYKDPEYPRKTDVRIPRGHFQSIPPGH